MTDSPPPTNAAASPWQIFMLGLCLFVLGTLAVETAAEVDVETRSVLEIADWLVCGLFFVDFVVCFVTAKSRLRYMATWGWLDLLSCVPAVPALRWGRLARVARILRILRAIRAARMLSLLVARRRTESAVMATLLLSLIVLVVGSIGVLQFERADGQNIHTAEDAVWWAFTTMTTVGYGDRYPTTTEGRVIAVVLMFAGIGLFGAFTGLLASLFVRDDSTQTDRLAAIEAELKSLRALLEPRTETAAKPVDSTESIGD